MTLLPVWIHSFSCRQLHSTTRHFSTRILSIDTSASTSASTSTADKTLWFDSFVQTFSGDFDNYDQVVTDRLAGLFPREGGGHEHIHCTLIPISHNERLAAFYFDGNPNNIFRFRYYNYQFIVDEHQQPKQINMKLYTIHPDLEFILRQESDPIKWITLWTAAYCSTTTIANLVTLLPNCDVQWSTTPDPIQHWYHTSDQSGFHAVMTYGEALVQSQRDPDVLILVRDQLTLLDNEFWIHDRGYNPNTMEFIYGNQKLIPYHLKRVTQILPNTTTRQVSNDTLQWTLGPAYRTEQEYQQKLSVVKSMTSNIHPIQ